MKDIIIKLRENEDRSIIFKMPYTSKPDLKLALHPLKQGTLQVSWEVEDYKNVKENLKEKKNGKIKTNEPDG